MGYKIVFKNNYLTSCITSLLQDKEGNQVWICPACGGQDDGSPMIGCDGCDAWYHWWVPILQQMLLSVTYFSIVLTETLAETVSPVGFTHMKIMLNLYPYSSLIIFQMLCLRYHFKLYIIYIIVFYIFISTFLIIKFTWI